VSVELRRVRFDDEDAAGLLADADAYNESLYGHADQSPLDPAEFTDDAGGAFLVACRDGRPVGCGGLRRPHPPAPPGSAEIKRLFVVVSARRHGLAARILRALEDTAQVHGYHDVILDVGGRQATAHAFYESQGYERVPGFSMYRDVPGNRAYGKRVKAADGAPAAARRQG